MRYRAEIDGLRAVAVVPVILFHAGYELFSGGYVGVDVFFVISGYLITGILLREMERGDFRLIHFYERRARRILPALFLVMAACLPFAWLWLLPHDLEKFSRSLAAVSTFSSNMLFWWESGYFDTAAELKPLIHTWSLAVEEQYYILFPLFLMLAWPLGRRGLLALLAMIFAGSLAAAHWSAIDERSGAFFLLPTRGWEILIGAFAAFALHGRPVPQRTTSLRQAGSLIGLVLIAFAVFAFDEYTPFPSLYTLVPTVGTGLILLFAVPGTVAHTLLSRRALVGVGLISYSAYLWHQPLLAFARHRSSADPGPLLVAALCLLTFPLAYLSWRFVENPWRDRAFVGRNVVFGSSAIAALVFIGLGLLGDRAGGFESRPINQRFRLMDFEPNNYALQEESWRYLHERSGDPDYGVSGNEFDRTLGFDLDDGRSRMLLVGNSHSKDLYNVLHNSRTARERFQIARFGTQVGSLSPGLFQLPNYVHADIVVLVSRYAEDDLAEIEPVIERILREGRQLVIVRSIFELHQTLGRTLADVMIQKALEENIEIDATYVQRINEEHYIQYRQRDRQPDLARVDARIDELAAAWPEIVVLDRMTYVCDPAESLCFAINDRLAKYFFDEAHHTLAGAEFFGGRVDAIDWLEPLGHTPAPREATRKSAENPN